MIVFPGIGWLPKSHSPGWPALETPLRERYGGAMTAKQFSYTEDQWREIEKYLLPVISRDTLLTSLDSLCWRSEISEAVKHFLQSQKSGRRAVGKTDQREHIEKGAVILDKLTRWIVEGRSRGFLGPDFDALREQHIEKIKKALAEYGLQHLQTRRGRPRRGESPLAVKNDSWDDLISRLRKHFDALNKRKTVHILGPPPLSGNSRSIFKTEFKTVTRRRSTAFLNACYEPVRIYLIKVLKIPSEHVPSLTAANLRQMAHRLMKAETKRLRKV